MFLNHRPTKILINGKSGTGKTTAAIRILQAFPALRKLVFDTEGEMSQRLNVVPCMSLEELAKREQNEKLVVYDPCDEFAGDLPNAFDAFNEYLFLSRKANPTKTLGYADELQKLIYAQFNDQNFFANLESGRRLGIDFIFVAQQVNILHNRVRNQLTETISFQQTDKTALKWLQESGFDPEELKTLQLGEWVSINHGSSAVMRNFSRLSQEKKLAPLSQEE